MTESDLQELLEFATGRGKWAWKGSGMCTHPTGDDNALGLHAGCVELERRGLLKRHLDEPGQVVWVSSTPNHGQI